MHAPNGAIVAAPTTSLPERVGGDKNYDYRYMWVRDSSYTIDAFMRLGLPEQVHESFCCLLRAIRSTAPDLRPFYSVEGTAAKRREELPLRGYRNSQPVRYGNGAGSQLQLVCGLSRHERDDAMRPGLDLDLGRDLVLHHARDDARKAVARRLTDDGCRLRRVGQLQRELGQRRPVDQPLPAARTTRPQPPGLGPAPHRVHADPQQLGGLPHLEFGHSQEIIPQMR